MPAPRSWAASTRRPADQQRHAELRRRRQGDEAGRRHALEGARPQRRTPSISTTSSPAPLPGAVNMGEVIAWLNKRLPDDAIVTNGAGNYAALAAPLLPVSRLPDPARADQRRDGLRRAGGGGGQDRRSPTAWWCRFAGDGCFLMNGQEFATAVQHGANIVIVVVDNGMYGTIRMHQEREYPTRVLRHRAQEPRLRRLRPRLRRPRRDGREDRGLRRRPSSARSAPASPRSSM